MTEKVIIAGFGGQGILFLGKLLAQSGMAQDHHVTFFPAYGPEVRGGRANCHVILSSDEIFSPRIDQADAALAMNQMSWDYFANCVRSDGLAVVNTSTVELEPGVGPERVIGVPATELADEAGDVRVTNLVMLGAYHRARQLLSADVLMATLRTMLPGAKAALLDVNCAAFQRGIEAAEAQVCRTA
ncbi:MAG: 2-oxoacid:acceptor oxidoreductase family protein [Planctomycetota bacterium]